MTHHINRSFLTLSTIWDHDEGARLIQADQKSQIIQNTIESVTRTILTSSVSLRLFPKLTFRLYLLRNIDPEIPVANSEPLTQILDSLRKGVSVNENMIRLKEYIESISNADSPCVFVKQIHDLLQKGYSLEETESRLTVHLKTILKLQSPPILAEHIKKIEMLDDFLINMNTRHVTMSPDLMSILFSPLLGLEPEEQLKRYSLGLKIYRRSLESLLVKVCYQALKTHTAFLGIFDDLVKRALWANTPTFSQEKAWDKKTARWALNDDVILDMQIADCAELEQLESSILNEEDASVKLQKAQHIFNRRQFRKRMRANPKIIVYKTLAETDPVYTKHFQYRTMKAAETVLRFSNKNSTG